MPSNAPPDGYGGTVQATRVEFVVGRPADLLVLKDGSMLISDDFNGAVYRVTYDGASVAR